MTEKKKIWKEIREIWDTGTQREWKEMESKIKELLKQNDLKHQKETEKLREALKKIEKPEGAYSRDNLTFCENTVENMKEIARKALKEK